MKEISLDNIIKISNQYYQQKYLQMSTIALKTVLLPSWTQIHSTEDWLQSLNPSASPKCYVKLCHVKLCQW